MKIKTKIIICFLLAFCFTVSAQEKKVTGTVSDQNNNTIPGVTVLIKGTNTGVATNADGIYTISIPSEPATLIFSSVGYLSQEIIVKNSVINVTLEESDNPLDEVVVVGYGTQVKANLTGAVQSVSTKELESRPITNLSAGLQGLVSGVEVIQSGGEPGDDFGNIRIRGVNNIEDTSVPLVIIDGMEGNINHVNPKDIQSMSVLKDASSSAIYGNRAAGGVIIITTKSGQIGKIKVNFSTNLALQQATALPDIVDAYKWNSLYNEINEYSGMYDPTGDNNQRALEDGRRVPVNWYDKYYSIAPMQDYYLNISGGGNRNFKGSVSLGVLNQDGILFNTDYKKYTIRANTDSWLLNNRLYFRTRINGVYGDRGQNHTPSSSMIDIVNKRNPSTSFRAINGVYTSSAIDFAIKQFGGITNRKNYLVNGRAYATLKILQFGKHLLNLQGSYGGTVSTNYFLDYVPEYVTSVDLEGTNMQRRSGTILKNWSLNFTKVAE